MKEKYFLMFLLSSVRSFEVSFTCCRGENWLFLSGIWTVDSWSCSAQTMWKKIVSVSCHSRLPVSCCQTKSFCCCCCGCHCWTFPSGKESSRLVISERSMWEEDSITEGPWLSCQLLSALRRHQLIISPPEPHASSKVHSSGSYYMNLEIVSTNLCS